MSRSRNWCFTINNYEECDENNVFGMSVDSVYTVCGKEVGESGTPHLQGFVSFKNEKSLAQMQDYIPRSHLEKKRGTFKEASDYCKKDNDYFEHGTLPMDQKEKGLAEAERWKMAFDCVKEGRLDEMDVQIKCTHLKSIEYAVQKEMMCKIDTSTLDGPMEHEWIYGEPDTGKSRWVDQTYPGCYKKDPKERWWDKYHGQEVVSIEDFDIYQKAQGGDMKRWLDRYSFLAAVKGGYLEIRPKKIIVTSNHHPEEIWDDPMTVAAILRRVKVMKFTGKWWLEDRDPTAP